MLVKIRTTDVSDRLAVGSLRQTRMRFLVVAQRTVDRIEQRSTSERHHDADRPRTTAGGRHHEVVGSVLLHEEIEIVDQVDLFGP